MALQIFTASLLKEGLVAYLCMDEGNVYWSTDIGNAKAVDINDIQLLEAAAVKSEKDNIIVGPYAIDVEATDNGVFPLTKREQIRADGPTILMPITQTDTAASQKQHAA